MPASRRYNVVFIMTDQQSLNQLRCYGSPWMHTPNLDRLAASGCRFNWAFTTTPVCTPARAGLFTGMYASSAGAACNEEPGYRTTEFLGQIVGAHGITPGYIGKWHLNGLEGGYYGNGKPDGGFLPEYWYDGRRFINDVGEAGFKKWYAGKDLDDSDCWGTRVADRAVRFIERHHDRPFLLVASFDEPHGPSSAPERFYDLYRGTRRPWQPNMGDRLDEKKPAVHFAYKEMKEKAAYVPDGQDPNNNLRYYGCVSFADEQIGRILDAVDRYCADNTAVIFTTDHGDMQGAHTMTGKGPVMYEEAIRVPLLVRVPGVTNPGSTSDALISQIHLAPTVCQLLGIAQHPQFHGRTLEPLLRDPNAAWDDAVFLEYGRFGISHDNHWGFVPSRTIRMRRHKLVLNLCDKDELYDLAEDPGEIDNRIDDPSLAEVRNQLHDRLLAWMDERMDPLRGQGWYGRPWRPGLRLDPFAERMKKHAGTQ
jgi:uncharacterized sulfatase